MRKKTFRFLYHAFLFSLLFIYSNQVQSQGEPQTDLLFIIDSSGSMAATLEGERMIDWAKRAVKSAAQQLPPEAYAGLRVYAHRIDKSNKEASCKDTELVVPIGKGTASNIATSTEKLKPLGWTPIAYSLQQAEGDFNHNVERLHTIILVSDGEETCGGDPAAVMRELTQKGYRFKLCTVGFNVEEVARKQLEALASEFGCTYTDVRSGVSLEQELAKLTQQSFLIEKKDLERIRGGDDFSTAVPIETGKRYRLDHHQRKGQFDYFSLKLLAGQSVSLHAFPVEKCVQIVGDQAKEIQNRSCDPEGYHFTLVNKNQNQVADLSDRAMWEGKRTSFVELSGETQDYYLLVGSPTADMHRDQEFMVEVKGFGDANTDKDAGDSYATAIPVTAGIYETNRISGVDEADLFKINLERGASVKISVSNVKNEGYGSMSSDIVDELGTILAADEVYANASFVFESKNPLSGNIYIRVKMRSNQFDSDTIYYSLGISVTPTSGEALPSMPPTFPDAETPAETSQTTPLSSSQLILIEVAALVLLLGIFSFFFIRKPKSPVNLLGKILAWFEIGASTAAMIFGLFIFEKWGGFGHQLCFFILQTMIGGLGIIASGLLISGRTPKPAFWWGLLQIPWIFFNIYWLKFNFQIAFIISGIIVIFLLLLFFYQKKFREVTP